jgi:purine catabolism regulator
MKGFKLIAGAEGLNREVCQVTVMEVPDFPEYMQENVFVLTTLYALKEDTNLVSEIIAKLGSMKIAGLAIKIGRFIEEVPSYVIETANNYGLPLFSMDKNITFREAIGTISAEIIDSQFNTFKDLNKQYEYLLSSVLKGDKIEVFVKCLGEGLNCYCACVSPLGQMLAHYVPSELQGGDEDVELLVNEASNSRRSLLGYTQINDDYLFPCLARDQFMGYLVLKGINQMSDSQLLFVRQMVVFLSIKLLEKHLVIETEQRMITAIADEILFQRYENEALLQERIKLLGLTPQKYHFVIFISFRNTESNESLQFASHQLLTRLRSVFTHSAVFFRSTEIVAIVSLPDQSLTAYHKTIKRAMTTLMKNGQMQQNNKFDLGYSMSVTDLRQIPNCYEQANKAIRLGRIFKPESNLFCYDEFIKEGLLLHSLGTNEYSMMARTIIDPIRKYDEKCNAELWATLEACLVMGSLEKAAQALHIHSSSLRYRLQRIHDITGTNFFLPEGRFVLQMAYVLSKLDSGTTPEVSL